jgi:hypothetical protein
MSIHVPGLKNVDKPVVWVFPKIIVCLDCGTAEFAVPKLNCACLRKAPLRQVNLGLSLTAY